MLLIVYQTLGALGLAALALLAPFVPALRRGLGERLGLPGRTGRPPAAGAAAAETIWLHAAPVGEVRAAGPPAI